MDGYGPLATFKCRSIEQYADNDGKVGFLYSFEGVRTTAATDSGAAEVGGTLTLSSNAALPVQVGMRYALDLSPAIRAVDSVIDAEQLGKSLDRLAAES